MFPGYVLINMVMNDDTWYVVRNTRGVTGFVGPGSKPVTYRFASGAGRFLTLVRLSVCPQPAGDGAGDDGELLSFDLVVRGGGF